MINSYEMDDSMAKTTHVSLTEAKQHLGELVKRAAYGGERIVLESHGRPQAVIVSPSDLERLENDPEDKWERGRRAMERLDKLRAEIFARTGLQSDSAEDLRQIREEREEYLGNLP